MTTNIAPKRNPRSSFVRSFLVPVLCTCCDQEEGGGGCQKQRDKMLQGLGVLVLVPIRYSVGRPKAKASGKQAVPESNIGHHGDQIVALLSALLMVFGQMLLSVKGVLVASGMFEFFSTRYNKQNINA